MSEKELDILELLYYQLMQEDHSAFEKIFQLYYDRILGFCIQFIHDRHLAEEVTQDSFVKLWQNKKTIDKPSGIKSFLFTAAKTGCINAIRAHYFCIYCSSFWSKSILYLFPNQR